MRRAAKIDDNHREIVRELERCFCDVLSLAAVGNGCPDLLVQRAGVLYLLEVKDGSKSPSRRRLTPLQQEFKAKWRGKVHVVKSVGEALAAVGVRPMPDSLIPGHGSG